MSYQQPSIESPAIEENYKDTVFRDLFGSEERKENALSLYNALNGTSHSNPDDLTLTTIKGVIYLGYRNDVSFLIDDEMVLWEHQSTVNRNMPLRGLFYFSELYSRLLAPNKRALYREKLIPLPTLHYYVFYVGKEDVPESETLRLSSAFTGGPGDLEVSATVFDVREGRNSAIMEACSVLADYSHLVSLVYENAEEMPVSEAIDRAVQCCIDEGVLRDYLLERRAEVTSWLLTEYDEKEHLYWTRQEGWEDGREAGIAEALTQLVRDGLLPAKEAAARLGITEEELVGMCTPENFQ